MILFAFSTREHRLTSRWTQTYTNDGTVFAGSAAELRELATRDDPDVVVLEPAFFSTDVELSLVETRPPSAVGPMIVAALPDAYSTEAEPRALDLLSRGVHVLVDCSDSALDSSVRVIKSVHEQHVRLRRSVGVFSEASHEIGAVPFEIDGEGRFVFVGDTIAALGLCPQELVGVHFSRILPATEHPFLDRDRVLSRFKGNATGRLSAPQLFNERRSGLRHTQTAPVRLGVEGPITAWVSSWGVADGRGGGSRGIIWTRHPGSRGGDYPISPEPLSAAALIENLAAYYSAETAAGCLSFDTAGVDPTVTIAVDPAATVAVDPVRLVQGLRDLLYATAIHNVPCVVTPEIRADGDIRLMVIGTKACTPVPGNDPWLLAAERSLSEIGFTYLMEPGADKNVCVIQLSPHLSAGHATAAAHPEAVILVVDDEAISRQVGVRVAGALGFKTITAPDGKDALEIMSARSVSLVLMDVNMPGVDGVEATKRLRAGECSATRRDVPVVAVTACADSLHREEFLSIGFDEHVSKPVDIAALAGIVRRLVPNLLRRPGRGADPAQTKTGFSLAHMFDRYQDSTDILLQVLELFAVETPDRLMQIKQAAEPVDFRVVGTLAHKLANTTGTLGGQEAMETARKLETAARAEDKTETQQLLETLVPLVEEMVAVVSAALTSAESSTSFRGDAVPGSG